MIKRALLVSLGLGLGLSAALGPNAFADITVVKTDSAELALGGMVQMLGFAQHLDDPYKNDDRAYLFMNRARLRMSGRYDDIWFHTEMGLGGEDAVVATTGVSLSLLDFVFDIPLFHSQTTYLKVGQFKVPYGREQLAYEANLQFADRSIDNLGFVVGRDVGVALVSRPGPLTLIGGVSSRKRRAATCRPTTTCPRSWASPSSSRAPASATSTSIPSRSPRTIGSSIKTQRRDLQRVVFEEYSSTRRCSTSSSRTSRSSSTQTGTHSSPARLLQGELRQAGADAAGRLPLQAVDLAGEAEFDFGGARTVTARFRMRGVRAQGGVIIRTFELAARYAASARTATGST